MMIVAGSPSWQLWGIPKPQYDCVKPVIKKPSLKNGFLTVMTSTVECMPRNNKSGTSDQIANEWQRFVYREESDNMYRCVEIDLSIHHQQIRNHTPITLDLEENRPFLRIPCSSLLLLLSRTTGFCQGTGFVSTGCIECVWGYRGSSLRNQFTDGSSSAGNAHG